MLVRGGMGGGEGGWEVGWGDGVLGGMMVCWVSVLVRGRVGDGELSEW